MRYCETNLHLFDDEFVIDVDPDLKVIKFRGPEDGPTDFAARFFFHDTDSARRVLDAARQLARAMGIADVEPEQCGKWFRWADDDGSIDHAYCDLEVRHPGPHASTVNADLDDDSVTRVVTGDLEVEES